MEKSDLQKQLSQFEKEGKDLTYLLNYLFTLDDSVMKATNELMQLGYSEYEIKLCLEYDFGLTIH